MKNIFNPKMLFFSSKSVEKIENEQEENEDLLSLSKDDVLKTLDIAPKTNDTKPEEIQQEITKKMASEEKNAILNRIDSIVNVIKSAIFSDEVESQEVTDEVVVNEDAQESVSEETEVVEDGAEQAPAEEQPSNDSEENEPSEEETVETEEKPEEGQEEPQEQETPAEEEKPEGEEVKEQEEKPAEEGGEEQEEKPAEDEQSVEVTDEIPTPINAKVTDKKVDELEKSDLLKQIDELKTANEKKDLELKKMALTKEVEKDFSGVPGKIEDKVDLVFEIKNATLSDKTKDFILNSLKSLSIQNITDCNEIGHDQEVEVDENAEQKNKIEKAIKEHNLTESQALLFVRGERTLDDAKKISNKVRRNRK